MKFISKSIKTKMLIILGALMIAVCVGLGIVSYLATSNALLGNIDQTLPQMASESAKVIESRIQGEINTLETLASMQQIKDANIPWSDKKVIFNKVAQTRGFLRVGIADANGNVVYNTGATSNVSDREYFQKALSGEDAVSDPTIAKVDGLLSVMYAVPIKMSDGSNSVIVAVRDGNELSKLTGDITFGSSGKAYMVSKSGAIIAHSNNNLVMNATNFIEEAKKDPTLQPLADVIKQMTEGKTGSGSYTYEGIEKYDGFAPVNGTGWSIGVTSDKNEVLSALDPLKTSVFIFSLLFLLIGILIILLLTGSISNSIITTAKHLSLIASGDLTKEVQPASLKKQNEIGNLARSVKTMQDFFRDMVKTIRENSNNIDSQSDNLSSVAQEMSSSSENVTTAIQDVAKGAGSQAEDLMQITGTLNEFAEQLDGIVKAIREVDINVKGVSTRAEDSNSNMQLLFNSVNAVNESFKDFVTKITGFGQNVKQINEITNLINSIADQTNLLALNAAIEAARAGEAGKGFAVVADEIRKLAEQTKSSSEDINALISGISYDTDAMVKITGVMDRELNGQIAAINTTIDSFKQIIDDIRDISPKIGAVDNSTAELDDEKNNILDKVQGVSSIAEEVSASSEEIAASSEEMNASTEEVASAAQVLSNMTKEMMDQVNKFRI